MTPLQLTLDNTTLMEAIEWRDLHPAAYQKIPDLPFRPRRSKCDPAPVAVQEVTCGS